MNRTERIIEIAISLLKSGEIKTAKGLVNAMQVNGGYWLTKAEIELLKAIYKCW